MEQAVKRRRNRKRTSRRDTGGRQGSLVVGGLSLNIPERSLSIHGNCIHMTPKICALLQVFIANRGKVLARRFLAEKLGNQLHGRYENTRCSHTRASQGAWRPLRDGPVFHKQSCCQGLVALSRRGTCRPNNSRSPFSDRKPLFNNRAHPVRGS